MKKQLTHILIVTALVIIALMPRVFDLDTFLAADEKRWLANVTGFTMALANGEFDNLLQQPHPGITIQWFGAPTVFSNSWVIRKLPLVIVQSLLILMTGYIAYRLWGKTVSIFTILLLSLNPFLIAHTRVYAMDPFLAHFYLLSILLLLLWDMAGSTRYLVFSSFAGALAVLSKLPGILIVPLAVGFVLSMHRDTTRNNIKSGTIWILCFIIATVVFLPSLVINFVNVMDDLTGFFQSENYLTEHEGSKLYYLRTLTFFSTPLHIISAAALLWLWRTFDMQKRKHLGVLIGSAATFFIMMSMGSKMGDRYILPVFALFDVITAFSMTEMIQSVTKRVRIRNYEVGIRHLFLFSFFIFLSFQAYDLYRLHPYYLAYVNPITKPFFADRRIGWGEGLDLAAQYLNSKPDAGDLHIAAYYPNEFATYFKGDVSPLHTWNDGNADYAVLYRAMLERGNGAWETDVLNQFSQQTPEKIITLNGIEYSWIYKL